MANGSCGIAWPGPLKRFTYNVPVMGYMKSIILTVTKLGMADAIIFVIVVVILDDWIMVLVQVYPPPFLAPIIVCSRCGDFSSNVSPTSLTNVHKYEWSFSAVATPATYGFVVVVGSLW